MWKEMGLIQDLDRENSLLRKLSKTGYIYIGPHKQPIIIVVDNKILYTTTLAD